MTFPLIETIYANLSFLESSGYLTRFDSCANSVREYLGYRIPGIQFNKFLHLTNVEKRELCAKEQITNLVQHIKYNEQDGLYWVIFNDLNIEHEEPEVFSHTFTAEKQGDNFCLVQTYRNIGNRSVCGISVQSKREDIINRLENIARLVKGKFVIWNQEDWQVYSNNLAIPYKNIMRDHQPIYNPQADWKFIPLSNKGCLYNLYCKAKEKSDVTLMQILEERDKDYLEAFDLQALIDSINAEVREIN